MNDKGRLILFCGKMGAGKTTLSRTMAAKADAVLISEDEWLSAHYPDLINSFEDYLHYSKLIKPFIKQLVQSMLAGGVTVVMDFPANTVRQRAWLAGLAREAGCTHELVYLNISDQTCLSRIAKRSKEEPARAQFDTPAVFHEVTKYFEPPQPDEELNVVEKNEVVPGK